MAGTSQTSVEVDLESKEVGEGDCVRRNGRVGRGPVPSPVCRDPRQESHERREVGCVQGLDRDCKIGRRYLDRVQ